MDVTRYVSAGVGIAVSSFFLVKFGINAGFCVHCQGLSNKKHDSLSRFMQLISMTIISLGIMALIVLNIISIDTKFPHYLKFIPTIIYYNLILLKGIFRLRTTFDGSIYQTSNKSIKFFIICQIIYFISINIMNIKFSVHNGFENIEHNDILFIVAYCSAILFFFITAGGMFFQFNKKLLAVVVDQHMNKQHWRSTIDMININININIQTGQRGTANLQTANANINSSAGQDKDEDKDEKRVGEINKEKLDIQDMQIVYQITKHSILASFNLILILIHTILCMIYFFYFGWDIDNKYAQIVFMVVVILGAAMITSISASLWMSFIYGDKMYRNICNGLHQSCQKCCLKLAYKSISKRSISYSSSNSALPPPVVNIGSATSSVPS